MHKCKRCMQASNFHTRAHNHSVFHADNDTPLSRPKHLLIMMGNCRLPQSSCWARDPRRTTGVHVFGTGTTAGRSAQADSKWRKTTSHFRWGLLKALKSRWRSRLEHLFSIGFASELRFSIWYQVAIQHNTKRNLTHEEPLKFMEPFHCTNCTKLFERKEKDLKNVIFLSVKNRIVVFFLHSIFFWKIERFHGCKNFSTEPLMLIMHNHMTIVFHYLNLALFLTMVYNHTNSHAIYLWVIGWEVHFFHKVLQWSFKNDQETFFTV